MKTSARVLLFLIIVAGMTASARVLVERIRYEAANDTVEVVVDLSDVLAAFPIHSSPDYATLRETRRTLFFSGAGAFPPAAPNVTLRRVLDRIAAAGAVSIGVRELTLQEAVDSGAIVPIPAGDASSAPARRRLVFSRRGAFERDARAFIRACFGDDACPEPPRGCFINAPPEKYKEITLGLPDLDSPLRIVPRFFNSPFETRASIRLKFSKLKSIPLSAAAVFEGDSILGYPNLLNETQSELRAANMLYGWLELVEQDGADWMRALKRGTMLPVHGISPEELMKISPAESRERFVRAVRERGVRVVYLRLPVERTGLTPARLFEKNMDYVSDVVGAIRNAGFSVGPVGRLEPFEASPPQRTAIFAGMISFCLLLLSFLVRLPGWLPAAIGALSVPAHVLALRLGQDVHAAKAASLAVACLVPACAVAFAFLRGRRLDKGAAAPLSLARTVSLWLQCSLLSLLAGLFIASALAERDFFLRMDVFKGVKAAYVAPLVLVFIFYLASGGTGVKQFLEKPVRYAEMLIVIVMIALAGVYLLRSGHEGPALTSALERQARDKLEFYLGVRPRTKEFLIGHPALIAGGALPFVPGGIAGAAVLIAGTVGQVSIVNTFCHLHSPLALSLSRTMTGIVLGLAVGIALRTALNIAMSLYRRK
ncbi:MAG: DUF5693 family protein [bacterium]